MSWSSHGGTQHIDMSLLGSISSGFKSQIQKLPNNSYSPLLIFCILSFYKLHDPVLKTMESDDNVLFKNGKTKLVSLSFRGVVNNT